MLDLDAFADPKDMCGRFFRHTLLAVRPEIPADASVLEIGCAEFDWLAHAQQAWPGLKLHGIDWRKYTGGARETAAVTRGDVRDRSHYAEASFDWVVSISAIEHVGLGHYSKDPLDDMGDIVAIENAAFWLKPGGWLYFDVPYNDRYEVLGTKCRVYDDAAVDDRLVSGPQHRLYGSLTPDAPIIERPTARLEKFGFVGVWWRKPDAVSA